MLRAGITGIACSAFLCAGYWVLEHVIKKRCREKVLPVVTNLKQGIDLDTEDRISRLPDDVITLIVSRLCTRDAVRTSVLSRRWKNVYTLISEVRFYCSRMSNDSDPCMTLEGEELSEYHRKFVQAVDTFFQHHSGSGITSFKLVCCFRGCISDSFRKWMNHVGRLGVENLTIQYCCPNNVTKSNPPVFSSDFLPEASSVKQIYLTGGSFQITNQKALIDLELTDVALTSEAVKCILLSCSSLQSLKLNSCILPSKLHIQGPHLQLKTLRVFQCSEVEEILLSAETLTTFELCTRRMGMLTILFSNLPLLQNISMEVCESIVAPYLFLQVAIELVNLECLYFWTDAKFFKVFETCRANKFSHLKQLDLFLDHENKLDLLALAIILDLCPLLQKFHLSMRLPSTFDGKLAKKRVVRKHTLLKDLKFSGFSGTENEYNFILCILENAVFLERLSIFLDVIDYHVILRTWLHTNLYQGDRQLQQRIIREKLEGHSISKNVDIIIV